jgi:hypothetical protein
MEQHAKLGLTPREWELLQEFARDHGVKRAERLYRALREVKDARLQLLRPAGRTAPDAMVHRR